MVIARALGTLDLPQYPSLEAFGSDLVRFAAPDPEACVRELVSSRLATAENSGGDAERTGSNSRR